MRSCASDEPADPNWPPYDCPEGLMFFNEHEARAVDAVTVRIIPSEPDSLGAREAAVLTYIDRAVAGYFVIFKDHITGRV